MPLSLLVIVFLFDVVDADELEQFFWHDWI